MKSEEESSKVLLTPPEEESGPKLVRVNDLEAELLLSIRTCAPPDQLAVLDAVSSIVRTLTKNRRKANPASAEVIALCDPFRKFPRRPSS